MDCALSGALGAGLRAHAAHPFGPQSQPCGGVPHFPPAQDQVIGCPQLVLQAGAGWRIGAGAGRRVVMARVRAGECPTGGVPGLAGGDSQAAFKRVMVQMTVVRHVYSLFAVNIGSR
jgi:hypothetical protein